MIDLTSMRKEAILGKGVRERGDYQMRQEVPLS
jgi:hypothetical protein